jgi:hypothetical protein
MEGGGVMSDRTLKALLGTLGILLVIWAGVSLFSGRGGTSGDPTGAVSGFFQGVTPESTSEVRIRKPEDGTTVEIRREAGSWTVNGYATDSGTVARFWDAMGEADFGDRMASNPANHSRMGVSADSAIQLEIVTGSDARILLVGKTGPRYGTAFARLPDEDPVYLLEGNLRSHLTRSLDDWRNKRMAGLDTTAIQRLEVERDGEAYALERGDSLWTLTSGDSVDATALNGILSELAGLQASGFYTAGDSLSESGATVRAYDEAGDTLLELEIGAGDGDRWARVEGDSILYRLPSWRVTRVVPDRERIGSGSGT